MKELNATSENHFYRVIWRWHFYAGLFVIPFLVILSVTGIVYLFKPQLDDLMYRRLMFVEVGKKITSPDDQLVSVKATYPNAKIIRFRPNQKADRSSEFDILNGQNDLKIFVNPYNNKILGELDNKNNLQYYAVEIHGKLLSGRFGEWIIELAVCWTLVPLISGLYLWFPRKTSLIWGILLPRLRLKNKRMFWRDVHSVIGFYGVPLIAFMIFTGLPWTDFWGKNILRSREFYPLANREKPKSAVTMDSLNTAGAKTIPWTVEEMPLPNSDTEHAGHENHHENSAHSTDEKTPVQSSLKPLALGRIMQIAESNHAPADSIIALPQTADGVYTISAFPNDPATQTTIHIDQYSGAVLTDVRWKDYGFLPKTVETGISLHEGKYFGLANQMLMFFAALIILLLAFSGIVMWWQRRPSNRLGAPPMPENFPLWKTAVGIIFVMSVLFPLVGVSLIIILIFDYTILQRCSSIKRLFN